METCEEVAQDQWVSLLRVVANAMPSRMTFGQIIECLAGKVGAISAREIDGTAFGKIDVEELKKELEKYGFKQDCTEYMYSGFTGERLDIEYFIGPLPYQRLKHQVADKIHSRSRGPVQLLTRQPPEGRSREGGLRSPLIIAMISIRLLWQIKLLQVIVWMATFPNCGNTLTA